MTPADLRSGRFIDLATHGGCSRKVNALRLEGLLEGLQLSQGWADAAMVSVEGLTFATTVDVVLPMIDDPAIFGEIVVAHVLSDLYATGASPIFGVNVLGVPEKSPAYDEPIRVMLASAQRAFERTGARLLGGHSIENEQLFFGLSATGRVSRAGRTLSGALPGDSLVLSKPLGTSIASWGWRTRGDSIATFADVVAGMRTHNTLAAELLTTASVHACTDVSGFGLAGHLGNLLSANAMSARVSLAALPRYGSTASYASDCPGSQLLDLNEDYVLGRVTWAHGAPDHAAKVYAYDAQVSGGLLAAVPREEVAALLARASDIGHPMSVIGRVDAGPSGHIIFES